MKPDRENSLNERGVTLSALRFRDFLPNQMKTASANSKKLVVAVSFCVIVAVGYGIAAGVTKCADLTCSSTKYSGATPAALGSAPNATTTTTLPAMAPFTTDLVPVDGVGNMTECEIVKAAFPTVAIPNDCQLVGRVDPIYGQTGIIMNGPDVIQIVLDNYNLTAPVDPRLGALKSITILRLSHNQITGAIPDSLGNLRKLTLFDFHTSNLTGQIPNSLWNLANVIDLDLQAGQLVGQIPDCFGNLKSMTKFFLNNNTLTGALPESMGSLPALNDFYVNNNQLSGTVPANYANLHLNFFSAFANRITGGCAMLNANATVCDP